MNSIKLIINEWDPIDLLLHAPEDEYAFEIKEIKKLLNDNINLENLSEGIYEIFKLNFGDIFKKSKSDCILIAEKILFINK
ncbi:hypothetical protein SDC9_124022 [bioreactor metagenome]|uniref:DUF1871 domain-containing protein n=1 Tax=bioreactor metagenome TaxID=1076179 RepID=A0A645CJC8_9ZZZZ|nr:DUF1871 family protein [Oscillospiraceae bacterium]